VDAAKIRLPADLLQYSAKRLQGKGLGLTASTSKKVTIERFEREPLHGFINLQTFVQPGGVELLSVAGAVLSVPWSEVKAIRFVRDFLTGKPALERQVFLTRPKSEGLWVRMQFRDGDNLEGVLPNNLLMLEPGGFTIVPPDAAGNTQKVYVPKTALTGMQVLGVVGSPLRSRRPAAGDQKKQIGLFDNS